LRCKMATEFDSSHSRRALWRLAAVAFCIRLCTGTGFDSQPQVAFASSSRSSRPGGFPQAAHRENVQARSRGERSALVQLRSSMLLGLPVLARGVAGQASTAFLSLRGLLAAAAAVLLLGRQAVRRFGNDDSAMQNLMARHTNVEVVDAIGLPSREGGPHQNLVCKADTSAGVHWYVGEAGKSLPPVRWFLKKDDVLQRVLLLGGLGFAESYMDGDWETDDLERIIFEMLKLENIKSELGWRALPLASNIFWGALKWKLRPGNCRAGARENINKTYDYLDSPKLYERMLGQTMQYTCAYFHSPGMTLDEAQSAKMDLIAQKLDLKPGMKVLEIGFGFGAQAYYLASKFGVHVTGATLSKEQMAWAIKHNAHPNIEYRHEDYRDIQGRFDRIYSVGMFEHVGRNSYERYFDKCYDLLEDDGIMLIHCMGWAKRGEWNHHGFINKYIFPGGEMPTMAHFTQEFSDRWHLEDWQSCGKSYVQTLRCWLDEIKSWEGLDEFDMRFRRMWEYYLAACAASFEKRRVKLWQIVWTKQTGSRVDDCYHIRKPAAGV
ncbi:unnamed protein product, partial [Polarella glacialis]